MALEYEKPLGGVVAISSTLLEEEALAAPLNSGHSGRPPRQTPILVTHGRRDGMVPVEQARRHLVLLRSRYGDNKEAANTLVRWKEYEGKGHDMIKSKEEMQDVMAFLAEHLRLRSVALEQRDDLIEISPGGQ
jgi:predicted esterase